MSLRFGVVIAALVIAPVARAADPFVPVEQQTRLSLDANWWPSPDAQAVAMSLNAQVQVHREWLLTFDLPWAAGNITGDPNVRGGLGNPELGFRAIMLVARSFALWGALSGSVPTTYKVLETNAGVASTSLLTFAALTNDGFEVERYFPEYASLRITPLGFEGASGNWRFRLELSLIILLPGGADTAGAMYIPQGWGEIEARLPMGFLVGVRAQALYVALLPEGTVAGGPYVGYEPIKTGFFARVGVLVGSGLSSNANPPLFTAAWIFGPYSDRVITTLDARFGYRF